MAKIKRHEFIVEGSGQFPFDMLRYDSCWPATEQDSPLLRPDWDSGPRRVTLATDNPFAPTIGRWTSQKWQVVALTDHGLAGSGSRAGRR